MSLTGAILRTWRAPRATLAALLAQDRREGRLLMYLTLALVLVFVAQWPRLARQANDDLPLEALMAGALFGLVFLGPLLAYALAGLIHAGLRLAGPVDGFAVRLALFWALLAMAPWVLAQAALAALTGPGLVAQVSGLAVLVGFAAILGAGLRQARIRPARAA